MLHTSFKKERLFLMGTSNNSRMNTNRTLMTLIGQIIADKIIIYHNHLRHLRSIISF